MNYQTIVKKEDYESCELNLGNPENDPFGVENNCTLIKTQFTKGLIWYSRYVWMWTSIVVVLDIKKYRIVDTYT
jgi:hypothetical protein